MDTSVLRSHRKPCFSPGEGTPPNVSRPVCIKSIVGEKQKKGRPRGYSHDFPSSQQLPAGFQ